MLWIFERRGQRAIAELIQIRPRKYALRFVDAEGVERFEHFKSAKDAQTGLVDLGQVLGLLGWRRVEGDGGGEVVAGQALTDQGQFIRIAQEAVQEAERRALARGLTEAEIQREAEDAKSGYWDDVRAVMDLLKRTPIH